MTSALMHLKNRALAEFEGRGPGIQWRITAKGRKALDAPDDEADAPREKPARKPKKASPPQRKAAGKKKPRKAAVAKAMTKPTTYVPPPPKVIDDSPTTIPQASLASFTSKGQIVLTGGTTTVFTIDESRAVIELVRAFDNAGLLPRAESAVHVDIAAAQIEAAQLAGDKMAELIAANASRIKRALRNS
jgi:hypothetical protein